MSAMSLSVQEAQQRLPDLVSRTAGSPEPWFISDAGRRVAMLVGIEEWSRRDPVPADDSRARLSQESRLCEYEERMRQLGPEFWPSALEETRLRELVDRQDSLPASERNELTELVARNEKLMLRRAAAMQGGR